MLPLAKQALRFVGRHSDVVTYISAYTLRRLQRPFGRSTSFVHLPSGVDLPAYRRPTPATSIREALTVTCISRLVPRKGQDTLIRIWPRIVQRFPHARLLIVGEGPYESQLRMLAEGIPSVHFLGRVSDEERARILAGSDVFAMPARTRGRGLDVEGLGIVYLEAQAAGVPVIAGDSGGAPETVTAETGLVVRGGDEDALEAAVVKLLGSPELRQTMGAAGVAHVNREWAWGPLGARLSRVLFG